jgi:hypothetical protein
VRHQRQSGMVGAITPPNGDCLRLKNALMALIFICGDAVLQNRTA